MRLAALAAFAAACFPATALADDAAAPAPADPQQPAPACLAPKGQVAEQSIRGVRVGVRADLRDADGKPIKASSISYCVEGGGDLNLALTEVSDIVLVLSTADGDSIGAINPTSPAMSARAEFPKMKKLVKSGATTVYRVDQKRQLILGVAAGRVNFVAAADRLLLEYPNKLGYYMHRLGF